jgi:hypothetical protein
MKELESHQHRVVTVKEVKGDAVFHNGEVFTFHDTGLTRRVYVNADRTKVLKVPVSLLDYEHNRHEAESWENMSEEKRQEFAECKLLSNGWLEMEFLVTLKELSENEKVAEEWSHLELSAEDMAFAASCRNEVGFDKDGKMKCYDYDEYRRY